MLFTPALDTATLVAAGDSDLPVAVVGAGFSGTLLAINLQRQGVRTVLLERDPNKLARGVAYTTPDSAHLLNVRVSNMSAFPDDPTHFRRWLGVDSQEDANRFVSRATFGRYLREQLDAALATTPCRISVLREEVLAIDRAQGDLTLRLAGGGMVAARAVVLALGNPPPRPLPIFAGLSAPALIDDPWTANVTDGLGVDDHVLLVGTGLTAVDVALSLDRAGFTGRITALSRRGLAPRAHAPSGPVVEPVQRPDSQGSWLLRHVRRRADVLGWRAAVDELRPHTQDIWRAHSIEAQARFLRHLRPWWDVHRHRLAPSVADRISAMRTSGQLDFVAGKLLLVDQQDGKVALHWRARGADQPSVLRPTRIVNCTGPDGDLSRSGSPLLQWLLDSGMARADVHRLGLDTDRTGHVLDAAGRPHDQLLAVGPVTKGEAWEIIAVPDIRRQVWDLARYLANAHWVEGEGL